MHDIDDAELGHELAALGRVVPDVDLVDAVRADLETPSGRFPLARVAAIVLVALSAVLAIPDVREAAADWFGIGRTAVREVDELPSATSTTSLPAPTDAPADLGAAEDALGSAIRLPSPDLVGPIRAIEIGTDQVVVTWDDVSLTVRPITPDTPLYQKFVDSPDGIERPVLADGTPALWIADGHVIEREGLRELTGSVLLWAVDDVEYRLADAADVGTAVAIAESTD